MRLLIFITAVAALVGCSPRKTAETRSGADPKPPAQKPVLVELARVNRGMIEQILERSAALEAEAQVEVRARTQNPAIELLVEEGDKVEPGQVLLRLENDRQTTDYEESMSQFAKAQIDFQTTENLYKANLTSETEYRNANFTYEQARLRSENAKRQLEYTEVRALIRGTITRRMVRVGDQVSLGMPLFEIVDFDSIVANIHVPEQYLPKLKPDMEARLYSATLGEQPFPGYVKRVSPVVDAQAGTVKVVVGVKELGALRPGMWVNVELVLESKPDAVLIPKRAIVYDNDQTYAFKIHTDTNGMRVARRQLVVPLNADKAHLEPREGFETGDLIVVAGQTGLKDASPIRELKEAGTETAATATPATNAISSTTRATEKSVN